MQVLSSFLLLQLSTSYIHAQVKAELDMKVTEKNNSTISPPTQTATPPPQTNPSTPPPAAASANGEISAQEPAMLESWPGYFLENVKALIQTGIDSKELPSKVLVNLIRAEGGSFVELFNSNPNTINTFEFRPNSITEFNMATNYIKPTATSIHKYRSDNVGGYRWQTLRMKKIEEVELKLQVSYLYIFFLDAWKVEKVSMVPQFKDILGRSHPTLGNKEVVFYKPMPMNQDKNKLILDTDSSLIPKQ